MTGFELSTEEDKRCNHYSVKHLIEGFQKRCKSSSFPFTSEAGNIIIIALSKDKSQVKNDRVKVRLI